MPGSLWFNVAMGITVIVLFWSFDTGESNEADKRPAKSVDRSADRRPVAKPCVPRGVAKVRGYSRAGDRRLPRETGLR